MITRKPKKTEARPVTKGKKASDDSEARIMALINKGGSVREETGEEEQAFNQRVPKALLQRVSEALRNRKVKISRNSWINEAIIEKLEAEGF